MRRLAAVRPRSVEPCWLLLVLLGTFASAARAQSYGATAQVTREEFDALHSSDAVDREAGDRTAASNAGDILAAADGVVVQRTSSASAAPIVRGLTGYQVLLTVDELRLNDSLTRAGGNALLNLVDAESIAAIEVVRGPASVVHGSDALGGVVRVSTRRAGAAPGNAGSAGATAYLRGASAERAARAQGSLYGVTGAVGARLSFGRGHAGQVLRGDELGEQPFTGHDDWSFASRLEAAPDRRHRISLAHQSGHLFDVPRSDTSSPEDLETTKQLDRESAVLGYEGRFPQLGLKLHAYGGLALRREWRQRVREGQTRDERDRVLSYQSGLDVVLTPWQLASLELGGVAILEDIGSTRRTQDAGEPAFQQRGLERGRYLDSSRYDTYALYALLSQGLSEAWTLLVGTRATLVDARAPIDPLFDPDLGAALRLDRRLFGVVGSLGARYAISDQTAWVASLLGGFRAPNLEDFQALGGGARGFTIPNPQLDEERSYTLETGIKHDSRWQLQAYLFASLLDGLIIRVPATFDGVSEFEGRPVQTRDNASHSLLLGAELSALYRFESGLFGGLSSWATWGRTTHEGPSGEDLEEPASKLPPPIGVVQMGYEAPDDTYWVQGLLTVSLAQAQLSESDKNDVRICETGPDACTQVDGYWVATLRAGLRLDQTLTLALGVENIFDNAYKSFASGAYAPGRNFVASLRGTL